MDFLSLKEVVKLNRERLNLSQRELAKRVGVWDTYIGQIEKGEKLPSDALCLKIAAELGIDEWDLLISGYIERADGIARKFFEEIRCWMKDPLFVRLRKIQSIDQGLVQMLENPDFIACLQDPLWRDVFLSGSSSRGSDVPELLLCLGRLNKGQISALLHMAKALLSG